MQMTRRDFWTGALERAVRTVAQTLAAVLAAGMILTDGAAWKEALLAAATAGLLSLLTSVAASQIGDPESPSFVDEGLEP
jgi:hypothetical protein